MNKEDGAEEGDGISMRFAVLLAVGLLCMVLALNLLGSPEVPVGPEYLRRFDQEDLLEIVQVAPGGWHIVLRRPTRIDNGGGEMITKQVVVHDQGEPDLEQTRAWRARGVRVEHIDEPEAQSGWTGGLLVSALLGLGLWHLWQQMQRHRREGSPRQHLESLEKELKEGKITPEEFQRRSEAIMAEM